MKLKNKKTGEIIETCEIFENLHDKIRIRKNGIESYDYEYNSLAELAEEWEDVPEEPKKTWFIDALGNICDREAMTLKSGWDDKPLFEFETKEEAELAVRKLKAWKRLKDKGLRFKRWRFLYDRPGVWIQADSIPDTVEDLDILFDGEF